MTSSGVTLSFIISMCQEFCDDFANYVVHDSLGDLEVNELDQELEEFMMHMKIQILECFFCLWPSLCMDLMGEKNILTLMLDLRFNPMLLITSFVGCDVTLVFMVDYNKQLFIPLLVECYKFWCEWRSSSARLSGHRGLWTLNP